MAALRIEALTGRGIDQPYTAAYALRNWGVTPQLRALARERCEDKLADESAPWQEHKDAIRLLALLDTIDAKRERTQVSEAQGDKLLAFAAVRASLAGDTTALAAYSGGAVIPSLPAPVSAVPVLGIPDTSPAYSCAMCQDAGVLVTSKGAYPCPNCSSDAGPADAADLAY